MKECACQHLLSMQPSAPWIFTDVTHTLLMMEAPLSISSYEELFSVYHPACGERGNRCLSCCNGSFPHTNNCLMISQASCAQVCSCLSAETRFVFHKHFIELQSLNVGQRKAAGLSRPLRPNLYSGPRQTPG